MLRSVNVELKGRGLHVVMGPNGSGKTTLLKIISLIYEPTRGSVMVDGRSYWDLGSGERDSIRQHVVYVHDKPIILRGDVWYNVSLGLRLRGSDSYDYLEELVERYGVSELLRSNSRGLSAGQRRLISIIRALALKPRVLVLDEPFNYLDSSRVRMLLEDLTSMAGSSLVVVATHYMVRELVGNATRLYELVDGSLREQG
ncbi:MAG: ATP-binding cassette domain-containing protein [Acidilobaceae archaeon]